MEEMRGESELRSFADKPDEAGAVALIEAEGTKDELDGSGGAICLFHDDKLMVSDWVESVGWYGVDEDTELTVRGGVPFPPIIAEDLVDLFDGGGGAIHLADRNEWSISDFGWIVGLDGAVDEGARSANEPTSVEGTGV
jgi:hypothetical protein